MTFRFFGRSRRKRVKPSRLSSDQEAIDQVAAALEVIGNAKEELYGKITKEQIERLVRERRRR